MKRARLQGAPALGDNTGIALALAGVLVISPDTLLIRLSGLDGWSLTAWRGVLTGATMTLVWAVMRRGHLRRDITAGFGLPFCWIVFASASQNITFNFAAVEASVNVVLTALAAMPVLAALLSYLILGEKTPRSTWVAMVFTALGVLIVVGNAEDAIAAPQGNVWLAGALGVSCAALLASVFVVTRKYSALPVILATGVGSALGGLFAFAVDPAARSFSGELWVLLLMGLLVMPLSFTLLLSAPRFTSSTNVSLIILLEMVLGPLWVWLGTGERPNAMMIGGAALVFVTLSTYIISSARSPLESRTQP